MRICAEQSKVHPYQINLILSSDYAIKDGIRNIVSSTGITCQMGRIFFNRRRYLALMSCSR